MTDIQRIPVTLGNDQSKVIGRATIDAVGDLTIHIPNASLVDNLEHMLTVNQIRSLAVGVVYVPAVVEAQFHCPRGDKTFDTMAEMEDHVTKAHPEMKGWDEG